MIPNPPTITVPIKEDEHGAIRVSGTKTTLDVLITSYLQGESPEEIHESLPTVPLNDIYAVITYYLSNRKEVEKYLQRREKEFQQFRATMEAQYPPTITKEEWFRRFEEKKRQDSS